MQIGHYNTRPAHYGAGFVETFEANYIVEDTRVPEHNYTRIVAACLSQEHADKLCAALAWQDMLGEYTDAQRQGNDITNAGNAGNAREPRDPRNF